jgi:hypothetical protein
MCQHELGSTQTRYDREHGSLHGLVVCDGCEAVLLETHTQDYEPDFKELSLEELATIAAEAIAA